MNARSQDSLGRVAAHGGAVTLIGQLLRVVIQSASIIVLARLVSPQDFGLVVMVTTVVGVGEVLRDLGLSMAAIQARTLSAAQRDNLFWLNSFIGLCLTLVVFCLAVPLANIYGEPRLVPITQAISLTFLVNGMATQYRAQLTRQFRFFALVSIDVSSQIASLLAGVMIAIMGGGYWALVGQQVGQVVSAAALMVICGRWLPSRPSRSGRIFDIIKIGGPAAGTQLLGYLSRSADNLVVGIRFGPLSLGLYSKAFQLLMMPLNQINAPATTVALPVLSRLQDNEEKFSRFLLQGQVVMTNVTGGVLAYSIALADPMIGIVLGSQWSGAAPIFQILSVAGLFQVASYASYWAFLSLGLTAMNFRFALASRPVLIILIVVGSSWGVMGVATAYSIGAGLLWLWGLWWLRKNDRVPVAPMLRAGVRCVSIYLVIGSLGALSSRMMDSWSDAPRVCLAFATTSVGLGLMMIVSPKFRLDLKSVTVAIAMSFRRSAQGSAQVHV